MDKIEKKFRNQLNEYPQVLKLNVESMSVNRKRFKMTGDINDTEEEDIIESLNNIVEKIAGKDNRFEIIQKTSNPSIDGKILMFFIQNNEEDVMTDNIKDLIRAVLYIVIFTCIYYVNKNYLKWYY